MTLSWTWIILHSKVEFRTLAKFGDFSEFKRSCVLKVSRQSEERPLIDSMLWQLMQKYKVFTSELYENWKHLLSPENQQEKGRTEKMIFPFYFQKDSKTGV